MNNLTTARQGKITVFFKRLLREKPLGTLGAVITIAFILIAIFADVVSPFGMNETGAGAPLMAPCAEHLFGTDNLGRDILSRVIYGTRVSMIVGFVGSFIGTFISVVIGMLAGYLGGRFDVLTMRVVDAFMCFPNIVMLMVVLTIIGTGLMQVAVVIGVVWGVQGSTVIRSSTLAIRQNQYIEAAKVVGCSKFRVMLKHVLPNIVPEIIYLFTNNIPSIILTEASLSFLGFGVPAPYPSWGSMLNGSSRSYMFKAPWMAIWPGVMLCISVYGFNMFGDAIRDLLDPRLKGGNSRYGSKNSRAVNKFLKKQKARLAKENRL